MTIKADPRTMYVDASNINDPFEDGSWEHPFDKIQEGIDAASDGDTVQVRAGVYYEHVVVNKTVSLIGENRVSVIVDGNGTGTILYITSNHTQISDLSLMNSGVYPFTFWPPTYAAIRLSNVRNCTIQNVLASASEAGILMDHSINCTIINNEISNNTGQYQGTGIFVSGSGNLISSNRISNNLYGVCVSGYGNILRN